MDSNLFSKAERIMEADQLYRDNDEWLPFFMSNDLGIPYAYLVVGDHGTLNEIGEDVLNATWVALCNHMGVDYEAEYDSIESMQIIAEVKDES